MPARKKPTPSDPPPPRKARTVPGRKPRQPNLKADEKAALSHAAKALAEEVNGKLEQIEKKVTSKNYTPEQRRAANQRRVERNRRARRGTAAEPPKCKGTNFAGNPCRLPPLLVDNWDGEGEITGLYCIHHEPNITRAETDAYILHGTATKPVPRRVTVGEMAHELMRTAPALFLRPHLEALGLRIDPDTGELYQAHQGLKLYGYSRGGEVIKSRYPDLVAQANLAEKLMDRVFGKPRQAVDLASHNTTAQVHIVMDSERVSTVTEVLKNAGVFLNGHDPDKALPVAAEISEADVVED